MAKLEAPRELLEQVYEANMELVKRGLVIYSWGNVSGVCRERDIIAIKPSGVDYSTMKPEDIVVLRLSDGTICSENGLRPSSDTDTHLVLYRAFEAIGGITHTHSSYATMWAQACCELPCYGTTHADTFYGPVPITRRMKKPEIDANYEAETGNVIVEAFKNRNPLDMPAVLVSGHAPFTWGKTPAESVVNSVILEEVSKMAFGTRQINMIAETIQPALLNKHFMRKHGENAYYGQPKKS